MIRTILLPTSRFGVSPVDRPTVPKAEKTSKMTFSLLAKGLPFSSDLKIMNDTKTLNILS